MAAPSVKSGTGLTVIEDCSTTVGSASPVSPSAMLSGATIATAASLGSGSSGAGIQGTGAASIGNVSVTGNTMVGGIYALSAPVNLTGVLLGCHFRSILIDGNGISVMTQNNGAALLLHSSSLGTEQAAWVVGGSGKKLDLSYRPVLINPSKSSTARFYNSLDITDITHVGLAGSFTGGSNGIRADQFVIVRPITYINGETGNRATVQSVINHIDAEDCELYSRPSESFLLLFAPFGAGDGSAVTWFDDTSDSTNAVIEFPQAVDFTIPTAQAHINDNDLGFEFNGHSSGGGMYRLQNKTLRSTSPFYVRLKGSSTYAEPFINTIVGAGDVEIADGWEDRSIWDGCGPLQCSQPTLNGTIIKNAPGVGLFLDDDDGLANCTAIQIRDCVTGIEVDITGDPATCEIDISTHTLSGNTTDILYSGTGTLTVHATTAQSGSLVTSAPSGTIVVETPADTVTITSSESGSLIQIFTTNTQTVLDSTTGTSLAYEHSAETIDYVVQKAGFISQRVTGVVLSGSPTYAVTLQPDPAYKAGHGLILATDYNYNATTRVLTIAAAEQARDLYSALVEDFISESAYFNKPFPIQAVGIDRFDFLSDGTTAATIDSGDIQFWRGAGMEWEHATTGNKTHKFCFVTGTGTNAAGTKGYYQQVDGASPTALTLVSNNVSHAIQYYSDPNGDGNTADGYDRSGHLVVKLFNDGYYQAASNILDAYGISALESYEYVVPLQTVETGLGTGDRGITITVTDTTPSGTEYQTGYTFDYKIEGGASDSPSDLLRQWIYDVYTDPTASDYASKVNFNWPDPIVESGGSYSTRRGYVYGQDTTTTYHGFYVEEGSSYHPDFFRQQANDGTYFVTPVLSQISITGMPTAGANIRLQITNVTALSASNWQATTAYTAGQKVKRTTGIGTENTAGLYYVCTAPGTTGGTEPTWTTTPGNTTTDGAVTWTCYKVLYYDGDPSGATYSSSYTDGEEFISGDTFRVRFAELNGATSFKTYSTTGIVGASGFAVAVDVETEPTYAANAIDGSSLTSTFGLNIADVDVNVLMDDDYNHPELFAFYCYALTLSGGMYWFWGSITALSVAEYRNNTSVAEVFLDEENGYFIKQQDSDTSRYFRDDGLNPCKDPSTGGGAVAGNWKVPVYVQAVGSALTAPQAAQLAAASQCSTHSVADIRNGLGLASANLDAQLSAIPAEVLTAAQSAPIYADIRKVNNVTVDGAGTDADPFGPA